ncbi:MAG: InlB B-repeat-containing protein [Atopobiaceae bacterium]|nr:InlB B-repeat-containing protein [Atopobiaceae bacterium]
MSLRRRCSWARWTSQTHTVSFDAQGGSTVEAQQGIVHGEMATEPGDPIREHYWFDGWFLDAECSRPYDFATPVTDDLTLYAGWVAQAYEVLLIPGNADECQVQNVSYGELANKPADPVRSGYRFDGWFVDGDRTKPYDFEAPVQDNLVIEGRWTQEGFTVTFDVDGGTPQPAIQQVAPNDLVEEPSAPTKDGSVFVGWYEIVRTDLTDEEIDAILSDPVLISTVLVVGHEALLAYDFASPVTSELTLRAIWVGVTHTIAFQTNGGSAIAAEQGIAHGDAARQPANPTREGYTFAGWYVDAACTRPYFFTEPVLEDLTLYAGWKERTYTVIFASYGGTYISQQTVPHVRRATRPTNPRMVGYEFVYWYQPSWTVVGPLGGLVAQEDEPTQEYDFDAPVTSDLVLLAQWDEGSYTVRFDTDGGTPAPEDQSLEAGSYAQQPEDPQKEGQLFLGWYAQEPEPLSDEDAARFRNDPDLSREYWITDDNYLRYYFDFGLMTIDDDTTLYARWASPTHTVTFADEEGIVGQLTVDHGSTIAEDAALVREGYVAQAWYTDPEHAYRYDLGSSVASDITLYADRYLKDCDVTLMLGEAELYVQTLSWGQTLEQLPSSVEGYDFLGWYADAALSEPLDNSTPVTADMTVYGSWTPTILTVTLDSNGGTEVSPQTQQVAYGELATVPADPVREGYVFKGWYEDWTGCLTAEQLSMYAQSDDEDARELVSVLVMNDDGLYRVYDLKNQPTYSDVTLVALWEKSPSDDGNNTKPSDGSSGKATPAASTKPSTTATTATKPSATTLPRTGDVSGLPLAAALAMAGVGLIALARRAKEW